MGEMAEMYIRTLYELAEHCEFGDKSDDHMRPSAGGNHGQGTLPSVPAQGRPDTRACDGACASSGGDNTAG